MTALSAIGFVAAPSPAFASVHTPPPGCKGEQGYYYGLAQCAYSSYQYRALVRCSDRTYRTGPWVSGPSPVWSMATCYDADRLGLVANDVCMDVPD